MGVISSGVGVGCVCEAEGATGQHVGRVQGSKGSRNV